MDSAISTAPGSLRRVRPPTSDSAPSPGAVGPLDESLVVRPTARTRPQVTPLVWPTAPPDPSFAVTDPYVRRFWTAVIGPGAVADLLRLATAARRGRSLLRPVYLDVLLATGLAAVDGGRLLVPLEVPPVPHRLRTRLTPLLRRQHAMEMAEP